MPAQNENPPDSQVRLTRIYTRAGDQGRTRLASGREVSKNDLRLEAYGTLDELQVAIGAARDALAPAQATPSPLTSRVPDLSGLQTLDLHLIYIQNVLFSVCADLATPLEDRRPGMPLADEAHVRYLEQLIDALNSELPPLRDFILPGGHPAPTALHVCRVVCRRAERRLEDLAASADLGPWMRPLVNRLSDAFFVMARFARQQLERAGLARPEQIWQKDLQSPPMPLPR